MMAYQETREKCPRYMHCPMCAGLHQYNRANWTHGQYACNRCKETLAGAVVRQCAMCGETLHARHVDKMQLTVSELFPQRRGDYLQRLYFCKKHYYNARKFAGKMSKKNTFRHTTSEVKR
jgi:hypothetical protein